MLYSKHSDRSLNAVECINFFHNHTMWIFHWQKTTTYFCRNPTPNGDAIATKTAFQHESYRFGKPEMGTRFRRYSKVRALILGSSIPGAHKGWPPFGVWNFSYTTGFQTIGYSLDLTLQRRRESCWAHQPCKPIKYAYAQHDGRDQMKTTRFKQIGSDIANRIQPDSMRFENANAGLQTGTTSASTMKCGLW